MSMFKLEVLRKCLQENNNIALYTFGNSMFPTIKKGDKIIVEKIHGPILVNDIVLFFENQNENYFFVAHRVIKIIGERFYITKGDNNNNFDRPIRKQKILGKVVDIIPMKEDTIENHSEHIICT